MNKGTPAIVSILVFAILAIVALKVLGAVVGLVVKIVLLAVAVGVAALIYLTLQKKLGGPRA